MTPVKDKAGSVIRYLWITTDPLDKATQGPVNDAVLNELISSSVEVTREIWGISSDFRISIGQEHV